MKGLNQIEEKFDKLLNQKYFEVWIDDPFNVVDNSHKKFVIPMYAKSIEDLRTKMKKAMSIRNLIEQRRKQCRLYGGKFLYKMNDFPFLISDSFGRAF